ncbi:MAG: hypothetical protein HQ477_00230 [Chloroflexi bacterium]|nr:hypothetical protein [Chloroflexota bacterium]
MESALRVSISYGRDLTRIVATRTMPWLVVWFHNIVVGVYLLSVFRKVRSAIDLKSWDNWFPLGVIAAFVLLGIPVALGVFDFGLAGKDADRFQVVYTDIGIQTTAGIFAIVISLSLVAIQFAAQEYSHRIMEYYVRSVIFWSTLIVYLGIIVLAMLLQARSDGFESPRTVALVLIASILAVALLIPHFIVTASYLKPDFIIEKLLRRISTKYVAGLKLTSTGEVDVAPRNDRLLPVVEITERSIDRGDLTTTRSAIDRVIALQFELKSVVSGAVIDRYFADHLTRIGRKAVNQSDEEEAAARAIKALERIGAEGAPVIAAERIDLLGFIALRNGSDGAVEQMIHSLSVIAVTQQNEVLFKVIDSYQALVGRLASGGYDQLLIMLADRVSELADQVPSGVNILSRYLDLLESIGHDAADNRLIRVVLHVINVIRDRGVSIASNDAAEANAIVLRMLRIEQAMNSSEREALAVIGFARAEVEQAPKGSKVNRQPDELKNGESASDDGFSDLWDED